MDEWERVRWLVRDAGAEFGDLDGVTRALARCERRMGEPLRVGLAGTLKAGKSTLLNALLGAEVAATDATECTRVLTWYGYAERPQVRVVHDGGRRTEVPLSGTVAPTRLDRGRRGGSASDGRPDGWGRSDGRGGSGESGGLGFGLGGVPADRVERIEVGWPAEVLRRYTLIDTPGTSSTTPDVSERTCEFLAPAGGVCPADAIVYLMRSRHDADIALLQRIQEHDGGPLGVVGVLSRADELSAATDGVSGMDAARRLTRELRVDPELAGVQRDFLAVSGLLALRGRTLDGADLAALTALAALPDDTLRAALLSPGRFLRAALPTPPDPSARTGPLGSAARVTPLGSVAGVTPLTSVAGVGPLTSVAGVTPLGSGAPGGSSARIAPVGSSGESRQWRERLLGRFGLIGIRAAVEVVRRDGAAAAGGLVELSGVAELERTLDVRFGARHRQLTAYAALRELRSILAGLPARRAARLTRAAEHLLADSHALTELRVLAGLTALPLDEPELAALDRVLGGRGLAVTTRLGLPADAGPAAIRAAAGRELSHWHARLAEPLLDPASTRAFRAAVRSCEAAAR